MKSRTNQPLALGYGTYKICNDRLSDWIDILETAYLANYDYIDTAWYYHNEAMIGEALASLKAKYGPSFHFPVQTKIWPTQYLNVKEAVLSSLAKLKLKTLDSVLLHRPATNLAHDIYAWSELIELQKQGLIREIGVSNYDNEMIYFLHKFTNVMPQSNQIQFNLYYPRFDRVYSNHKLQINLQAWRPLTSALDQLLTDRVVTEIALKHQTTNIGVAIAYVKYYNISPIPKSNNLGRIQANAQAFFNVNLDQDDIQKLAKTWKFYDGNQLWGSATYPLNDENMNKNLVHELNEIKTKHSR